jgi:hypothetical protein
MSENLSAGGDIRGKGAVKVDIVLPLFFKMVIFKEKLQKIKDMSYMREISVINVTPRARRRNCGFSKFVGSCNAYIAELWGCS